MTSLANPRRLFHEALAAALRPPEPIDYLKFAADHVVFGPGEPRPGPWDRRAFGYFDAILQALGPNDPARIISLCASAQIGKTILGGVFSIGSVTMGRGTVLIAHPSLDNAARWSRMKLTPMLRSIPAAAALFPQRPRDAADAILFKERIDGLGNLLISGANSAASLSQLTAPYVLEDDLSKWQSNEAGDPEAQADSRARAHEFAKIFKMSTPLTLPDCRISKDFLAGSQERPHVPCPHCQTLIVLEWSAFHYEDPDAPYFICERRGTTIEEKHRSGMLAGFQWIAGNPDAARTHRSFWLWSAYSVLQSWPRIAAEWLRAQGDSAAEQVFSTDVLGLAYQPKGDARPPHELFARAERSHYSRGQVPPGALILTLGVDCQLDRCEWLLLGFGESYRRFVIDIGTVLKHISEPDCQRDLLAVMARRWPNAFGRYLDISMTAIDAGYSADDVLSFTHRCPSPSKVMAVRGVPGDATPRIARVQRERSEKTGTIYKFGGGRFFNLGVYGLKSSLYRDLSKDNPDEKGFVGFPNNLPLRFFEELVSERRVPYKRLGVTAYRWEKTSDRQPNEMHDCTIYATAAGLRCGVNFITAEGWADRREKLEGPPPPPPTGLRRGEVRIVDGPLTLADLLPH